jgi:anti-sigma factor RsiW
MKPLFDTTEIDRLVDGELDPAAYRDLLRRLDASPDGWRCCALAFLEAQQWARAARTWTRELAPEPAPDSFSPPRQPERVPRGVVRKPILRQRMRAAALLGIAFLAGFALRDRMARPTARDAGSFASGGSSAPLAPSGTSLPPSVRPQPVSGREVAALSQEPPPQLPEYIKAQWDRLGYQIEPGRQLISVEENGRRETFPVETYRVRYVGRPTY